MIGRQAGEGALDLAAVQRDDDLLALLAERGEVDTSDPVARLLASLAEDVDDGLAELLIATDPLTTAGATWVSHDVLPELESDPAPRARRTAAGAAALAVALAATLSVSGVAAAVTGDPLAPYKAVGSALSWGEDDLPETAAPIAHLNKRLARARAAIAHGEVEGAQSRLDAIRAALAGADLSDGQRAAFERKLDRLEAALADAGKKGSGADRPGDGRPADKPPAGDPPGQVGKDKTGDRASGKSAGAKGADGAADGATEKADKPEKGSAPDQDTSGKTSETDAPAKQPPAKDKPATAKATQSGTAPDAGKGRQKG
ncbi:MAG TPA: hypothetical protein VFV76_11060 [Actinomycetes bacterium]|nr:hypothetical protein [Actinomycetes bacterium]